MNFRQKKSGLILLTAFFIFGGLLPVQGQLLKRIAGREEVILADSYRCLNEIMEIPAKSIPISLFEKAEGVAIFPGLVKGSFILGAQHGNGVLIAKNEQGKWEAPRFMRMTGGSVGFQAGIQSADIILIFCTRRSVTAAIGGQFTIGADASVAAGPVGRQASASTNAQLTAEIYSYSRSRGLFLGVALDGCALDVDEAITRNYYANGLTESAQKLVHLTAGYVQQTPAGVAAAPETLESEESASISKASADREAARQLLLPAHEALMKILEPEWQKWLALPAELTSAPAPTSDSGAVLPDEASEAFAPSPELLTLQERIQRISEEPKYAELAARPEFMQVKLLLALYLGN